MISLLKCIVCHQNTWKPLYQDLLQCRHCHFVRAKNKYFHTNTTKLYHPSYFQGAEYVNYQEERPALEANFKNRLEVIRKYKGSGSLLEIGCAHGYFLSLAQHHFQCTGIDLNPQVTQIARQNTTAKILHGEFLHQRFQPNSFNVICMFDTIEHLKHPDRYLKKIHTILKKNGFIIIETGDIDTLLPKLQKNSWRLINPPYHLQYFSQQSLDQLLRNYQFQPVFSKHVSFYRSLNQTIFRLFGAGRLYHISQPIRRLTFPINTFDLTFTIAQKT